jgi:lipopolysaccharide export system protein LptA
MSVSVFSRSLFCRCGLSLAAAMVWVGAIATPSSGPAIAQATGSATPSNQPLTLRSDIQEANSITGVITARGNVQISYPARQLQATAAQAQYYSRERRIILSGDVYILQQGNSLRGEMVTYLVDEGRFFATPDAGNQVESTYIVADPNTPAPAATSSPIPIYNPKPDFKTPISPPTAPADSPLPSP